MPLFDYTAVDANGKNVKGSLDAETARSARSKLKASGLFPTTLQEATQKQKEKQKDIIKLLKSDRVSASDLSIATRQLATLIAAGLPLVSALAALVDQTDGQVFKRIIITTRENVEEGESLASSLSKFPKTFPPYYINMVQAGEASGSLDTVLNNLASYLEGQIALRQSIFSALMYPILMIIVCICVIIALLTFVVPKIVAVFIKQGAALPLPTQIVIGISDFVQSYWYLLLLMIFLIPTMFRYYYKQEHGRSLVDSLLFRIPIFGDLYTKICTTRISSTLGTLLSSGVGLLEGLDISKNIVQNVHVSKALVEAREGVREGRSLAKELSRSGIFPPMLIHMVAVGEKSGDLEAMLMNVSKSYGQEVDSTVNGLTSLLEPLMMLFVGAIVLFIVISILLPMSDLISIMQGPKL